jgi:hypothetical protein
MKRIALIFAGQPRAAKLSYSFFEKNLLHENEVDVFGCFWESDSQPDFGPWSFKEIRWIDPAPYDEERKNILQNYTREHSQFYPAENVLAMYQALSTCNDLPHENYDVVIRARTDFALNRSFDFSSLDLDKLHQPRERPAEGYISINDQFGFGSSRVMRTYFDTLSSAASFIADGGHLSGESLLNYHLIRHGYTSSDIVPHDMHPPFPPKGKDKFPHSLIRDDFVHWRGIDIANPGARERLRVITKEVRKFFKSLR